MVRGLHKQLAVTIEFENQRAADYASTTIFGASHVEAQAEPCQLCGGKTP